MIGSGGDGQVWKVVRDGREYALKVNFHGVKAVERQVMEQCHHPNLIRYHSILPGEILMELGVPLVEVVKQLSPLSIARQVLEGLVYLHSQGIDHNDLHLGNLLVVDGVVKICDFGRARHRSPYTVSKRDVEYFGYLMYNIIFKGGKGTGTRAERVEWMGVGQRGLWVDQMRSMGPELASMVEMMRGCCDGMDHRKLVEAEELLRRLP